MENELSYDSKDALRDFLKDIYESNGILAVEEWVKDHLKRGTVLIFKGVASGQKENHVSVWDRSMEILNPMNNTIVNKSFLPPLSSPIDFDKCELYLSLRILFISEPFGLVIYSQKK